MPSNFVEYYLQLWDKRLGRPIDDDSGLFTVLGASDPTIQTVFSNSFGTSLTLPGTMTNGVIQFWVDSTVTSVDISVLTASGRAYFLEGVTISTHRVDVMTEKMEYQLILPFHGNTACDAVADTGYDLLVGMRVKDIFLHVTTNLTATAIDVGISGDTDGFLDGMSASTTGFKRADVVTVSSETSSVSIVADAQLRGVELAVWDNGFSATATKGGSKGFFYRKYYVTTAATSLVWVVKETNSAFTGEGYIYVEYDLLPTAGN